MFSSAKQHLSAVQYAAANQNEISATKDREGQNEKDADLDSNRSCSEFGEDEPRVLLCFHCGQICSSAWELVQHFSQFHSQIYTPTNIGPTQPAKEDAPQPMDTSNNCPQHTPHSTERGNSFEVTIFELSVKVGQKHDSCNENIVGAGLGS